MLEDLPDSLLELVLDRLSYNQFHAFSQTSHAMRKFCTPRMRMCLNLVHGSKYRVVKRAFGCLANEQLLPVGW